MATGASLPWPAAEALALKFMAHHLWDPVKRESGDRHGMQVKVGDALRADGLLRTEGPHAPSAGASRAGRRCTAGAGLEGPFSSPVLPLDPARPH